VTSDNHVPAEALAAWAEGRLAAAEAATIDTHLSSCVSCQEMLAVFARTDLENVESGFSRTRSAAFSRSWFRWRWAVPVAVAATAAAIWVAVPNDPGEDEFERTIAPAIEERPAAPAPPASADSTAPIPPEKARPVESRRDAAASGFDDRAEKQASSANERDQDLKREAPPAAAEAARAPDAPPPSEQARLRTEAFTGAQRQAAITEATSPDPLVRWRIIPPARLERSTDGANTWEPVSLPQQINLAAVRAPSATTAIVTAADGRQFRTDDQGKTWNPVQP
jgi:hypothetical protein